MPGRWAGKSGNMRGIGRIDGIRIWEQDLLGCNDRSKDFGQDR